MIHGLDTGFLVTAEVLQPAITPKPNSQFPFDPPSALF